MFWNIIKWGGTAAFILIVVFVLFASDKEESDGQTQLPQQNSQPVQSGKKFNF